MKFLILNGPNLNMLGIREPQHYGHDSYETLVERVRSCCEDLGVESEFFQSNHEGALVDRIQAAYYEGIDGILLNPAAYTHTSVALLDALKAVGIPTVEVHLSKVSEREAFRQISYVREACLHAIFGMGIAGYCEAAMWLAAYLRQRA